jgi:uncharacterized protein (DUF302 family)
MQGKDTEMNDTDSSSLVETVSPLPFAATLARLETAIGKAGLTVFAKIDHAAGAREVGTTMPPTTVLVYGHAKGGTPLMLAAPQAALDLPLRVLVREREDGQTVIAFHPIAGVMRAAGVPEDLATRLEPAQRLLVQALA